MPENTESGRRENWDDGETEKKGKSCWRQSEVETKPETQETSAELAEWMPMARLGPALRRSRVLAPNGAECPASHVCSPADQLDFRNQGATNQNATHPSDSRPNACQKSVPLQNVRRRSDRRRRRAALLPVRADTARRPRSE